MVGSAVFQAYRSIEINRRAALTPSRSVRIPSNVGSAVFQAYRSIEINRRAACTTPAYRLLKSIVTPKIGRSLLCRNNRLPVLPGLLVLTEN